jgi:hypothetical protein
MVEVEQHQVHNALPEDSFQGVNHSHRRHPEVLAVLHGEPRRMGHERLRPSFETPRRRAAPQDDE